MATLRDAVYGAAVGDALGVPFEFNGRGLFTCTDMVGHGTHDQPAGTFSDDTSMLLGLCDSLRENGGAVDIDDIRSRFRRWLSFGDYAVDGLVFDMGITVSRALRSGQGCCGERDNGNGSLMRTIPLAFTDASNRAIRDVSGITHGHRISEDACVCFVRVAQDLMRGAPLEDAIRANAPAAEEFEFLADVTTWHIDQVKSGGFVLDTLGAAFWCLANTDNYRDCVVTAVNLGSDTDTTACVAGALAGIVYGFDAIPAEWVATLRGKDIIERCLFESC